MLPVSNGIVFLVVHAKIKMIHSSIIFFILDLYFIIIIVECVKAVPHTWDKLDGIFFM